MMLKKLVPNLMVEDVNRTIEFYKEVLSFELDQTVPDTGQFEWVSMRCGNVQMMFQAGASLIEEIPALRDSKIGGSLTFCVCGEGLI